jgi:hypothetical protein
MPINAKDDMERSDPQTESAREQGHHVDVDSRKYGSAETDPGQEGDIADEGAGHRDVRLDESRPTPGSAEDERNPNDQGASNVPGDRGDERQR